MRTTLVGSPDTIAAGIQHLLDISQGGFGGMLFRANEWATREQIMRSYELFARYVMPRFQGSLAPLAQSNQWVRDNRASVLKGNVEAVRKAFTDVGRAVPAEARARALGGQDEEMKIDE